MYGNENFAKGLESLLLVIRGEYQLLQLLHEESLIASQHPEELLRHQIF